MADELTCEQTCSSFGKLTLSQEAETTGGGGHGGYHGGYLRLHLTQMDYDCITESRALCKSNGALGAPEFAGVMRRQVHFYIKRKLQRSVSETEDQHAFATAAAIDIVWFFCRKR